MYGYDVDPTTWGHRTASLSPFWLGPAWSEGLVAAEPGALAPRPAELPPSPERLPHIALFGVISELGSWH